MNPLKPKSTVHNNKALLYKRFISLEKSINLNTVYYTISTQSYWTFDGETSVFSPISAEYGELGASVINVSDFTTILSYMGKYYRFSGVAWQEINRLENDVTLLSATFNNIGKYQVNKYYYAGSFDYMVKGSIEGATSQYLKGNIIPLTSMNIKYFTDTIELGVDDLVVIGDKIYAVENPETTMKMQPRPLKIHFATLNAIL